jgi:hypothetical protein
VKGVWEWWQKDERQNNLLFPTRQGNKRHHQLALFLLLTFCTTPLSSFHHSHLYPTLFPHLPHSSLYSPPPLTCYLHTTHAHTHLSLFLSLSLSLSFSILLLLYPPPSLSSSSFFDDFDIKVTYQNRLSLTHNIYSTSTWLF